MPDGVLGLWRRSRSYVGNRREATSDAERIDLPEGIPRDRARIERVDLDPKNPVTMLDGGERPPVPLDRGSEEEGESGSLKNCG